MELTQETVQWWAFVNVVVYIYVLYIENLWTHSLINDLARLSLHHGV
jgi:hypothetical protein